MSVDRLYVGGEIYTEDESLPTADAVATRGREIAAVGSESDCRAALGDDVEVDDLEGGALLPGFIDTHLHPVMLAYVDMNIDLDRSSSIAEVQQRISSAAAKAKPGAWLAGLQFNDQALPEKRLLTRKELDEAAGGHPLLVIRYDGHMTLANTAAIEASGIDASTPDPAGGSIDREPDGFPSGAFRENAAQLVMSYLPIPEPGEFVAGAQETFARLASFGITSIGAVVQSGEDGPAGPRGAFEILIMQFLSDRVPQNLFSMVLTDDEAKLDEALASPLNQPDGAGRGRNVGALKIIADGSFGSYTAYMDEPFTDRPESRGTMKMDSGELYRRMVMGHNKGLQLAIHCIGDAANREVVELYRRLLEEYPRPHRHRLEHASQLEPSTIEEMSRLGIIVSTQPLFIHSEKEWLETRLGDRTKMTYPFRTLLDAGIRLAGASDAPVEPVDVLDAIQCCVTREGFEESQCITAAEAVKMYTADAAYAISAEDSCGSITAGKRADLVHLSESPLTVPADKINSITVLKTIVGGETIYRRGADRAS